MWECQHYRAAEAASHIPKVKTKCFMCSRLHLRHILYPSKKKKKQLEARTCFGKYRSYNFLLTWKYSNKIKSKNDPHRSWSPHTKMYQNYRRSGRQWRFRLWTKKHSLFLTPLPFLALDWVCGRNIKGEENMPKTWVRDSSQQFCAAQGGELVIPTRKKEAGIALQGRPKTPHWEHAKWSCGSTRIKMMLSTLKPDTSSPRPTNSLQELETTNSYWTTIPVRNPNNQLSPEMQTSTASFGKVGLLLFQATQSIGLSLGNQYILQ